MQDTLTTPALTPFETALLEVIVYADLFDFPVTPEEAHRWLAMPADRESVDAALSGHSLRPLISRLPPYVTLAGRESIVDLRGRRRTSSSKLRRQAERYGAIMARLPFVRMVAITGALAVDNADETDDLDYLIVTAPGRVWLTRTMIMAIGRIAALRGVTLCPNYLLAESVLALSANDYYTARELLQMQPVAGHAVRQRMLDLNAWWRDHLPNAEPAPSPGPEDLERRGAVESPPPHDVTRPSLPRGAAEWLLRLPPFDAAERWVLRHKGAELRRDAGDEAVFDETVCKGHFDRWRQRTQHRLEERMRQVMGAER